MHAYVYKSQLKPDTYVYVPRRDDFSALPAPLLTSLGTPTFVLDVALMPSAAWPRPTRTRSAAK
jgi:uncharacterized protein YcgL (UPF0745 family)